MHSPECFGSIREETNTSASSTASAWSLFRSTIVWVTVYVETNQTNKPHRNKRHSISFSLTVTSFALQRLSFRLPQLRMKAQNAERGSGALGGTESRMQHSST